MKNNVIKLNESALRKIVAESVKTVIKDSSKEGLLSQIYEYVDEHGKEASGGKLVILGEALLIMKVMNLFTCG